MPRDPVGYVISRVAAAVSQLPRTIAREPYAQTLWMFVQLLEHDRIDALRARARDLSVASLGALAFHEPARLRDEHERLLSDAGLLPTADEAIEKTRAVVAAMERISAGTLKTRVVGAADGEEVS